MARRKRRGPCGLRITIRVPTSYPASDKAWLERTFASDDNPDSMRGLLKDALGEIDIVEGRLKFCEEQDKGKPKT